MLIVIVNKTSHFTASRQLQFKKDLTLRRVKPSETKLLSNVIRLPFYYQIEDDGKNEAMIVREKYKLSFQSVS